MYMVSIHSCTKLYFLHILSIIYCLASAIFHVDPFICLTRGLVIWMSIICSPNYPSWVITMREILRVSILPECEIETWGFFTQCGLVHHGFHTVLIFWQVFNFDHGSLVEKKLILIIFHPSALRAGGVLSSWSRRAAGCQIAEPISL